MHWASEHAHVLNVRAMMRGVVGRPGAPADPRELDFTQYLWLVEGIVRDINSDNHETLDKLYADAQREVERKKAVKAGAGGAHRADELNKFLQMVNA